MTDWLFKIAIMKVLKRVVILLCSFLFTKTSIEILQLLGIQVNVEQFQNELIMVIYGLVEFARGWIKQKYGLKWL